jgi:uncharacterized protein
MMIRLLAATALAATLPFMAAPAAAQQTAAAMMLENGHTLLTVNAQGTATSEPDMATFNAGVTTQAATASAALSENTTKMRAVFAALKRAGIAERDIQTSDLSVNPVYSQPQRRPDGGYDESERKIVAYQVNNRVTVRQRKLEDYGKVIDALVTAGANDVNGPGFTLSEPRASEDEARVGAIAEARRRADIYARAAGLKVVRILSIQENGGGSPIVVTAMRKMDAAMPAPPPVATGELETQVNLSVRFELAP